MLAMSIVIGSWLVLNAAFVIAMSFRRERDEVYDIGANVKPLRRG
jgi:hypothetical protein